LRSVLVENLFDSIIRSPLWDWDWIMDLYDEPRFGRDLLFFGPLKRELKGIGNFCMGDEAVKKRGAERLARMVLNDHEKIRDDDEQNPVRLVDVNTHEKTNYFQFLQIEQAKRAQFEFTIYIHYALLLTSLNESSSWRDAKVTF
jgi:hypothetical protein